MSEREYALSYGSSTVKVRLEEKSVIGSRVEQPDPPEIDAGAALIESLRTPIGMEPLASRLEKGVKVTLVCDDYTRPTPAYELLPALLGELNSAGIPDEDITLLVAPGFHRAMTGGEKEKKYGREACSRIRVEHHDALDYDSMRHLGETSHGIPVWINKLVTDAGVTIGIGVVEIHPWAGFAGGGKIVSPGAAGKKTINATHSLPCLPGVEIGETEGNCFWLSCIEASRMAGLDMIVNVVLDAAGRVTGLFAGEVAAAHRAGIAFFKKVNEVWFDDYADIVITSSSPKQQYWGLAVTAGYNVSRIVREGGTRIVLAACPEGLGDSQREKEFYHHSLKRKWGSIEEYWEATIGEEQDNSRNTCAVHRHLRDLERSDLIFVTDGFGPEMGELGSCEWTDSLEEALRMATKRQGPDAKIAVLDDGGMVLPSVRRKE